MDNANEILTELQELSPYLASINRSHPFDVPEHYFQQLEDAISKLSKTRQVKAIHEGVMQKKEHPFKAPVDYFNDLPGNMLSEIRHQVKRKGTQKSIDVTPYFSYKTLLVAASVALILMVVFMRKEVKLRTAQLTTTSSQEIVQDDATMYLLGSAAEIDEALVVELLVENKIKAKSTAGAVEQAEPSLIDVVDIDPELIDEI